MSKTKVPTGALAAAKEAIQAEHDLRGNYTPAGADKIAEVALKAGAEAIRQQERELLVGLIENERVGVDDTEQGRGYGMAIVNILHEIKKAATSSSLGSGEVLSELVARVKELEAELADTSDDRDRWLRVARESRQQERDRIIAQLKEMRAVTAGEQYRLSEAIRVMSADDNG